MIKIITNVKSTQKFLQSAKTNIMRSQTKLAKEVGKFAQAEVRHLAPVFRGKLRDRVAFKLFPKTHRAEVMMASPHFNMVGMQNEFNIGGRRKLYKSAYPKLADWAEEKGVFLNKPYVIVGGINTRLGKQNMFFQPAFMNTQVALPDIANVVFTEAIMRTRG